MTAPFARGACPSLLAPMETGDGLLVRMLPTGPVPLRAFAGLCAAALAQGNGTMEISARGSVQIRGLTPVTAPSFAAAVTALKLDIGDGVPVLADPLPGDPTALIDTNAFAAELRNAIASAALALAPKLSVIVDGGGKLHLDALNADIRVRAGATADGNGKLLHLAVAGDGATASPLGAVAPGEAPAAVLRLLAVIAAQGAQARAADVLRRCGIAGFQKAIGTRVALAPFLPARPPAEPVATHFLKDDLYALGVGLTFGHAEAETLRALADLARTHGGLWARPAPDRSLLLGPFKRSTIKPMRDEARRLGFAVDPADARRRIVACPGAPSCASGLIAARAIAAEIAKSLELPGHGVAVHVSGCAKGCAHPAATRLTIVGTEQGCGVVRDGMARATPSSYVVPESLAEEIDRIIDMQEMVDA
jgi:precorrin-3B synthase